MHAPNLFRRLLSNQRGAVAVEYGLILALIFLAMVGALSSLGGETGGLWSHVRDEVLSADAN